jgi:glyoxalase family protein
LRPHSPVDGLHHVTGITADIVTNLEFWGRLLGLRLVWQGVNVDDPEIRHIAYGDECGNPGSIVTFLDMPGVSRGRPGVGIVYRLGMRVASNGALDFWERRLTGAGVASERRSDSLAFSDPEGLELELVVDDGQDQPLIAVTKDIDERLAIRGLHGVRACGPESARHSELLGGVLGLESEGDGRWLARGEHRHARVVFDAASSAPRAMGAGAIHHIAFTIRDEDGDAWREHLASAGVRPTPVLDRRMFKSIYFREPNGVLLELATAGPGFVFEPRDRLGESLVLIGELEHRRTELERRFPMLPNPRA